MEILKPDLAAFNDIPDFNYPPQFVDFNGAQMHYIDEGTGDIIMALHGQPTWSYLYRKFIPVLNNYRFIAPDFVGFGKSDKLKNWEDYSFDFHLESIINLIEKKSLNNINLIVQDWGGLIGLSLLSEIKDKIKSLIILNTFLPKGDKLPLSFKMWQFYCRKHPSLPISKIIQKYTHSKLDAQVLKAYDLPFPNKEYKSGPVSFPQIVPATSTDQGVDKLLKAREVLSTWKKPALVMFSDNDPMFSGKEHFFLKHIPSCKNQPQIIIPEAGHFLQEDKGEQIANYIKLFLEQKLFSFQNKK